MSDVQAIKSRIEVLVENDLRRTVRTADKDAILIVAIRIAALADLLFETLSTAPLIALDVDNTIEDA